MHTFLLWEKVAQIFGLFYILIEIRKVNNRNFLKIISQLWKSEYSTDQFK
jgi:hypothetical protein